MVSTFWFLYFFSFLIWSKIVFIASLWKCIAFICYRYFSCSSWLLKLRFYHFFDYCYWLFLFGLEFFGSFLFWEFCAVCFCGFFLHLQLKKKKNLCNFCFVLYCLFQNCTLILGRFFCSCLEPFFSVVVHEQANVSEVFGIVKKTTKQPKTFPEQK